MKKKFSFIALAFAMFAMVAVSVLLFSGCDGLFENDTNDKNNGSEPSIDDDFDDTGGNDNDHGAGTGKITGLAVIIEYQDSRTVHTRQQVDELFNRVGGIRGGNVPMSIYDYYKHFSNGLLELNHVVAPVITLPFTREQSGGDFGGIYGLWREAKKIFDTMNFDMSGVTLNSQGNPVLITMLVSGGFASTAGAGLSRTRMSANSNSIPAISFGVLAHEIGHALLRWGHPGVSADGRCLMESGWKPNAYYRHTAGWIEPVDITSAPPGTVLTLEANSHQAFIFRRNEREAYYIEAQYTGSRPQGIRGRDDSGLLIWHIDMNAGRSGVGSGGFSRVELVHADGDINTVGEMDLFRSGGSTSFSGTTTPAARWHDGTLSNINITDISDVGASMTFRIGDMPATPFNGLLWQLWPYSSGAGDVVIEVDQNITLTSLINIPAPATAGATLTIRSANPSQPVTLTRGVSGNLFTTTNGATLIFKDIIIDGGNSGAFADNGGGSLVRVNGGTFIMNSGTVLRNNVNSGEGGGVFVNTNGTFTMNGGTINGNTATTDGGVRVNGTFTMNDGEISGNTAVNNAGGVFVDTNGTFTMNSGMISGNIASGNGGGLIVTNSAVSTMNGGEISGNKGANGGGVRISAGGVFTLANGKINNNTATANGGGVSMENSVTLFTMTGGEISGNTAGSYGGGVNIPSGNFIFENGEISNNTGLGGGINVTGSSAVVSMSGGKIIGNTATNNGGGVAVWGSAQFTMSGGEINGNTATADGGGVLVSGNSTVFNMTGGEIFGNTAGGNGNGVRRAGGTLNLNGGAVAGTGANIAAVVNGTNNLNTAAPNNAIVFAWDRPAGTLDYTDGSSTDLIVSTTSGGTAVWEERGGVLGISYKNGSNTGWIKQW